MKSNPAADSAGPLAAQAIDGVLEAERDAQAAVAACERAGSKVLEAARQRAGGIFERAQARAVALHGRAAKKLELCASDIMEQRMKAAAETVKQLSDPGRLGVALERVATRNASPSPRGSRSLSSRTSSAWSRKATNSSTRSGFGWLLRSAHNSGAYAAGRPKCAPRRRPHAAHS